MIKTLPPIIVEALPTKLLILAPSTKPKYVNIKLKRENITLHKI